MQSRGGAATMGRRHALRARGSEGLLLVGHGCAGRPDDTLRALAQRLEGAFAEVGVAALRGRPEPAAALRSLEADIIHLVPVLMAQGQMAERLLLAELGPGQGARLVVHPALGASPGIDAVVCRLIGRAAARLRLDDGALAVVLVGHGNPRHPAAAAVIRRLADRVRACSTIAAEVHCAFLAQHPLLEDWPVLTRCPSVLFVPCFVTAGVHVREDLPARIRMAAAGGGGRRAQRVRIVPPLATATDELAALICDVAAPANLPLQASA